jgi:hypothetical protein
MTGVIDSVEKAAEQAGLPLASSPASALSKPEDSSEKIAPAGKTAPDVGKDAGTQAVDTPPLSPSPSPFPSPPP